MVRLTLITFKGLMTLIVTLLPKLWLSRYALKLNESLIIILTS